MMRMCVNAYEQTTRISTPPAEDAVVGEMDVTEMEVLSAECSRAVNKIAVVAIAMVGIGSREWLRELRGNA